MATNKDFANRIVVVAESDVPDPENQIFGNGNNTEVM